MSIAALQVLGGIAHAGKDAYWQVADLLTPEDFPTPTLGNIYRLCGELDAFDFMLLAEEAEKRGVCSAAEVIDLAKSTASAANIRSWAERIRDGSMDRRFRQICRQGEESGDIAATQTAINDLLADKPAHAVPLKDAMRRMWDSLQARYDAGNALAGLPTGFPLLDEMTGGLQPKRVYGIAARVKMGKTILAMNICAHNALAGKHVAVWSLEMSEEELAQRMACAESGTPNRYLQSPKLFDENPEAMAGLYAGMKRLRDAPMVVNDRMGVSVEEIEAEARMMHAKGVLDLLCIDHLGLVKMPKADRHDLAVGHVTRRCKAIAKELAIPVLLVLQLNRGNESGAQVRPPRVSDARDSGNIEQDLDAMFLLHRPSYYDKNAPKGCRLDVGMQRNGPTGLIHLHDELDRCRFTGGAEPWAEDKAVVGGRDDSL